MSVRLMSQVWDSDLPANEKMVALALADWASDDGGSIFPSRAHLAWKVGKEVRAVQTTINKLRERGVLVPVGWKSGGRGRWRVYRLDASRLPARPPWEPSADNAPSQEPSAVLDTTECSFRTDRVQPTAHDPLEEPLGQTVRSDQRETNDNVVSHLSSKQRTTYGQSIPAETQVQARRAVDITQDAATMARARAIYEELNAGRILGA